MEFCGTIARNRDIREAAEEWKQSLAHRVSNCWAGFTEILCPIVVHDHLVAIAMTGQLVQVPDGAGADACEQRLHDIRDHAVPIAVETLDLSSTEEGELRKAFELEEWSTRQEERGRYWLVTEDQTEAKIETLNKTVQMIEGVAQDRYTKDRRLREAKRRFDRWRRECRGPGRIPTELWQLAAQAADEQTAEEPAGAARLARVLRPGLSCWMALPNGESRRVADRRLWTGQRPCCPGTGGQNAWRGSRRSWS